jgi:hypothetical protein
MPKSTWFRRICRMAGARAALTEPVRLAALDLDDDAVVVLLSTEGHTR